MLGRNREKARLDFLLKLEKKRIHNLLGSCRRPGPNPFELPKDLFMWLPASNSAEIHQFAPSLTP